MGIHGIESGLYGVEDLAAGIRFFEDCGLNCAERGTKGADFILPTGQAIRLRLAVDPSLPPAIEPGPTVREVVWGVDSDHALDEIGTELARDRKVRRDSAGVLHTLDPSGIPVGFRVSPPETYKLLAEPGDASSGPVRSQRISHIVWSLTKRKYPEMAAFYVDRLKFRISDRVRDNGDFVRAPGADDHHNIFLHHRDDRLRFNHLSIEVKDEGTFLHYGKYLEGRGWTSVFGPSSHYLSSHVFWFFATPCGGEFEIIHRTTYFDDTWETRVWDTAPRTGQPKSYEPDADRTEAIRVKAGD